MAEIELDNYSIHKQMYAKIDPPSMEKVNQMFTTVGAWASTHFKKPYYAILCKELSYYCFFNLQNPNFDKFVQELKKTFNFRGRVLDIEYNHAQDSYEVWIKDYKTKEINMYVLFECGDWVVEVE